jgi:uncharacterized protein
LMVVYSVAEHSEHVMDLVSNRAKPWALLHDASEAYTGDITRPMRRTLKQLAGKDIVSEIEARIAEVIRFKYGVPYDKEIAGEVMVADNIMLATEAKYLLHDGPINNWIRDVPPLLHNPFSAENYNKAFFRRAGRKLGLWE